MRHVTYTDKHRRLVESGIDAIREVLLSADEREKDSVLLCLDRYLDSYFGVCLPYQNEIIALLQECLFCPNTMSMKEDILRMLSEYATCPLDVLEARFSALEVSLQEEARRILSEP